MAVGEKTDEEAWNVLLNIEYLIHPTYGHPYLEQSDRNLFSDAISTLRRNKKTEYDIIRILQNNLNRLRKNEVKLNDWLYNKPRREAQKFISKKNIRDFILKRDNYKCLCCGDNNKLSLDHIISIHNGGGNTLSNLQTLCTSCNSRKGIKTIDYRNG